MAPFRARISRRSIYRLAVAVAGSAALSGCKPAAAVVSHIITSHLVGTWDAIIKSQTASDPTLNGAPLPDLIATVTITKTTWMLNIPKAQPSGATGFEYNFVDNTIGGGWKYSGSTLNMTVDPSSINQNHFADQNGNPLWSTFIVSGLPSTVRADGQVVAAWTPVKTSADPQHESPRKLTIGGAGKNQMSVTMVDEVLMGNPPTTFTFPTLAKKR